MLSEISEQGQISLGVRLPEVGREQFVLSVIAGADWGAGALADLLVPPPCFSEWCHYLGLINEWHRDWPRQLVLHNG